MFKNDISRTILLSAATIAVTLAFLPLPCYAQPAKPPATAKPPAANKPASAPAQPPAPTAEQIDQAIKAGMKFIHGKMKDDGSLPASPINQQFPCMVESLALLAGLTAGESGDSTINRVLYKFISSSPTTSVAGRSARIMAMCRLGADGIALAKTDAEWLCKQQQANGGWNYGPGQSKTLERSGQTDSLNTNLAVWALDLASANAIALPKEKEVWTKARDFWKNSQNSDGGWGYDPPKPTGVRIKGASYGTMTVGGLASLLALNEQWVSSPENASATESPDRKPIDLASKWLMDHFSIDTIPQYAWGDDSFEHFNYLFGLARLAGQMGLRSMNKKDISLEITKFLLPQQRKNGSWPAEPDAKESDDDIYYSCLAVLCLAELRQPVLISKLVASDSWFGAGVETAEATNWVSQKISARFGWQLLYTDLIHPFYGLAPILYVKSGDSLQIAAQPAKKIKSLLDNGGTLLIQATNKQAAQSIAKDVQQLFPQYEIQELNKEHPIFNVQYPCPAQAELAGFTLDDAVRSRVFIIGADLSAGWLTDPPKHVELLANMLLYTTDMVVPTGKWNAQQARPTGSPDKIIKIGRVKHAGEWNSCPKAVESLNDVLLSSLRIGVQQADCTDLSKATPKDFPILWITGSNDPQFTPQDFGSLKNYVTAGGTIFMDSIVGKPEFFQAANELLANIFGKDKLKPLPIDCQLLSGNFEGGIGADLKEVDYSKEVQKEKPSLKTPELYGVEVNGRIAVILSPYGVTCPLEGLPAYGCKGLSHIDACRLAANIVLYSLTRQ